MGHFSWITNFIVLNGENSIWIVEAPGVVYQKIEKNTLSFEAME